MKENYTGYNLCSKNGGKMGHFVEQCASKTRIQAYKINIKRKASHGNFQLHNPWVKMFLKYILWLASNSVKL